MSRSGHGYWGAGRGTFWSELGLHYRLPGAALIAYAFYNTNLFFRCGKCWESADVILMSIDTKKALRVGEARGSDDVVGTETLTRREDRPGGYAAVLGKLLEIEKVKYRLNPIAAYMVRYEFTVNGVTYQSRRGTSGSPFRDWMWPYYRDTITDQQYLQSMPLLRKGEPCLVFYDVANPGARCCIAHDPNSWELAFLMFVGTIPLLAGNTLRVAFWREWQQWFPKRMRVRVVDHAAMARAREKAAAEAAKRAEADAASSADATGKP